MESALATMESDAFTMSPRASGRAHTQVIEDVDSEASFETIEDALPASQNTSSITLSELSDRWNHAVDLYHSNQLKASHQEHRRLLRQLIAPELTSPASPKFPDNITNSTDDIDHFIIKYLWYNIGLIKLRRGEYLRAAAAFHESVAIDDTLVISWYGLGVAYYKAHSFRDSSRAFRAIKAIMNGQRRKEIETDLNVNLIGAKGLESNQGKKLVKFAFLKGQGACQIETDFPVDAIGVKGAEGKQSPTKEWFKQTFQFTITLAAVEKNNKKVVAKLEQQKNPTEDADDTTDGIEDIPPQNITAPKFKAPFSSYRPLHLFLGDGNMNEAIKYTGKMAYHMALTEITKGKTDERTYKPLPPLPIEDCDDAVILHYPPRLPKKGKTNDDALMDPDEFFSLSPTLDDKVEDRMSKVRVVSDAMANPEEFHTKSYYRKSLTNVDLCPTSGPVALEHKAPQTLVTAGPVISNQVNTAADNGLGEFYSDCYFLKPLTYVDPYRKIEAVFPKIEAVVPKIELTTPQAEVEVPKAAEILETNKETRKRLVGTIMAATETRRRKAAMEACLNNLTPVLQLQIPVSGSVISSTPQTPQTSSVNNSANVPASAAQEYRPSTWQTSVLQSGDIPASAAAWHQPGEWKPHNPQARDLYLMPEEGKEVGDESSAN